jgi:diaminopimelate epimerase
MNFTKMQGAGNDYVYVNLFQETLDLQKAPELARAVSDRHFGIGADGLILIAPPNTSGIAPEVANSNNPAHAEMIMYNADGSMSEMCGNGLRCVAKYVYDHNIAHNTTLRLQTGAGIKQAQIFTDQQGTAVNIKINMGKPILEGLAIPTIWESTPVINQPIQAGGQEFLATCVSMGNPHAVIYVDDVKNFPVEYFGPLLETAEYFPKRVNIEFVQIISPTEVIQRTWERGSGETLACGTGASAVCVAGVLTGNTSSDVLIHLLGGDLELQYTPGESVFMTGPAVEVFSGVW